MLFVQYHSAVISSLTPGNALVYIIYVLLLAYAVLKMQLFDIGSGGGSCNIGVVKTCTSARIAYGR